MVRLLPRLALGAAAICALAACAGAPAAPPATAPAPIILPPPTAPPTAEAPATMVPAATEAPAATAPVAPEATSEASEGGVLPAPLYVSLAGQIERIERDGVTRTKITSEPSKDAALAVTDFAVSTATGQIAYVTQKPEGGVALIITDADGQGRTVLYDNAETTVGSPVWSPDGAALAVAITYDAEARAAGSGVYRIAATGGEPSLIQANDVLTQTATSEADILPNKYGYIPMSYSPDGKRLLLSRYALQFEGGDSVLVPAEGGALTLFAQPSEDLWLGGATFGWSRDSASMYTTFTPGGDRYIYGAGLWRTNAADGTSAQIIPSEVGGKVPIVIAPFETADGRLLAFVGESAKLPTMFEEDVQNLPSFRMAQLDVASGTWKALRDEAYFSPNKVEWAPDGSGAAIWYSTPQSEVKLAWLPVAGDPLGYDLGSDLGGFAWGR